MPQITSAIEKDLANKLNAYVKSLGGDLVEYSRQYAAYQAASEGISFLRSAQARAADYANFCAAAFTVLTAAESKTFANKNTLLDQVDNAMALAISLKNDPDLANKILNHALNLMMNANFDWNREDDSRYKISNIFALKRQIHGFYFTKVGGATLSPLTPWHLTILETYFYKHFEKKDPAVSSASTIATNRIARLTAAARCHNDVITSGNAKDDAKGLAFTCNDELSTFVLLQEIDFKIEEAKKIISTKPGEANEALTGLLQSMFTHELKFDNNDAANNERLSLELIKRIFYLKSQIRTSYFAKASGVEISSLTIAHLAQLETYLHNCFHKKNTNITSPDKVTWEDKLTAGVECYDDLMSTGNITDGSKRLANEGDLSDIIFIQQMDSKIAAAEKLISTKPQQANENLSGLLNSMIERNFISPENQALSLETIKKIFSLKRQVQSSHFANISKININKSTGMQLNRLEECFCQYFTDKYSKTLKGGECFGEESRLRLIANCHEDVIQTGDISADAKRLPAAKEIKLAAIIFFQEIDFAIEQAKALMSTEPEKANVALTSVMTRLIQSPYDLTCRPAGLDAIEKIFVIKRHIHESHFCKNAEDRVIQKASVSLHNLEQYFYQRFAKKESLLDFKREEKLTAACKCLNDIISSGSISDEGKLLPAAQEGELKKAIDSPAPSGNYREALMQSLAESTQSATEGGLQKAIASIKPSGNYCEALMQTLGTSNQLGLLPTQSALTTLLNAMMNLPISFSEISDKLKKAQNNKVTPLTQCNQILSAAMKLIFVESACKDKTENCIKKIQTIFAIKRKLLKARVDSINTDNLVIEQDKYNGSNDAAVYAYGTKECLDQLEAYCINRMRNTDDYTYFWKGNSTRDQKLTLALNCIDSIIEKGFIEKKYLNDPAASDTLGRILKGGRVNQLLGDRLGTSATAKMTKPTIKILVPTWGNVNTMDSSMVNIRPPDSTKRPKWRRQIDTGIR